jgi:hypothetical protein
MTQIIYKMAEMTHSVSLGAIGKYDGKYTCPKMATRRGEYICPECGKDLIVVKGEIKSHHFRHKVDSVNPCNYYTKPTESQIHKDAKLLMKSLLENRVPIRFTRGCVSCKSDVEVVLPEVSDGSAIFLEHRFEHLGELRIADIAHVIGGEIRSIYEICYTHKTLEERRPEPWVEIDAVALLAAANSKCESLAIGCVRSDSGLKCQKCVSEQKDAPACKGDGECLVQCQCECYNKKTYRFYKVCVCGHRAHDGYCPSNCCTLVYCENCPYRSKGPKWYMECHGDMCQPCNMNRIEAEQKRDNAKARKIAAEKRRFYARAHAERIADTSEAERLDDVIESVRRLRAAAGL